jgi:hypothetical protein
LKERESGHGVDEQQAECEELEEEKGWCFAFAACA